MNKVGDIFIIKPGGTAKADIDFCPSRFTETGVFFYTLKHIHLLKGEQNYGKNTTQTLFNGGSDA